MIIKLVGIFLLVEAFSASVTAILSEKHPTANALYMAVYVGVVGIQVSAGVYLLYVGMN